MKILLTGASGMVGKNLLESPGAQNHQWLTPSREELDLLKFEAVISYLREKSPDAIVHAAGRVGGIQANISDPDQFLVENFDLGRNILMAAFQQNITKLVNLGSTCMYPCDRDDSLAESDLLTGPLEPTNEGYAIAKIAITRLGRYLSNKRRDLLYRTLIPCNLYGRHDNFDPGRSHMIPAVIHKIHQAKEQGKRFVEIWGDGTARREYLYAADLAEMILMALEKLESLPDTINVGCGYDYTIQDYYQLVAEIIGYEGSLINNLSKPTGMKRKLSDVTLAKKLGLVSLHSLRQGLLKTYEYYLEKVAQPR